MLTPIKNTINNLHVKKPRDLLNKIHNINMDQKTLTSFCI